jgi:hypothetical protein
MFPQLQNKRILVIIPRLQLFFNIVSALQNNSILYVLGTAGVIITKVFSMKNL